MDDLVALIRDHGVTEGRTAGTGEIAVISLGGSQRHADLLDEPLSWWLAFTPPRDGLPRVRRASPSRCHRPPLARGRGTSAARSRPRARSWAALLPGEPAPG